MPRFHACLLVLGLSLTSCGSVESSDPIDAAAIDGAETTDAMPDALLCAPGSTSCGAEDAVFQCNEEGTELTKLTDCQYGCTAGACNVCEASTTFCNGDDLAMCNAEGQIGSTVSCNDRGCQMDRCNTCVPGVAFCEGAESVACNSDGTPGTRRSCAPNTCNQGLGICNACSGNATTCQGDTLVVCSNDEVQSATNCAFGCEATGAPHCKVPTPSFGVPRPTNVAGLDLVVNATATMNLSGCRASSTVAVTIGTTTEMLVGAPRVAVVAQAGAPAICVVKYDRISIESGRTLSITNAASDGSSDNVALALTAQGTVDIQGAIVFRNSGNGFAKGTDTSAASVEGDEHAPGAGGGGHVRAGGNGGACTGGHCGAATVSGGVGGAALDVSKLFGGSRGGDVLVTGTTTKVGTGGSGGGGLHLVALQTLTIGATATISVGGLGGVGVGGGRVLVGNDPAGGGGSGGTLVIEAPVVSLSAGAIAVANGGGGAGGCYVCNPLTRICTHANGQPGQTSATRALGGMCANGGNGGDAANGQAGQNGQNSDSGGLTSGGGGGGSDGVIVLRARDAARVQRDPSAIVSPAPTIGAVTAN